MKSIKRVITLFAAALLCVGPMNSYGQAITSFSPTYAKAGEYVDIYGTAFTTSTYVWFGSIQASAALVSYSGSIYDIRAVVPSGLPTNGVQIGVGNGTSSPTAKFAGYKFTNITSAPFIVSFSPESGSAGTAVTILGANFTSLTGVSFNGVAASYSVVQTGQINTVVPTGATTGPIKVTNAYGTGVSVGTFYVMPVITNFTPVSAHVGDTVIVRGANFLGATAVTFADVTSSFTVNSNSQITTTIPSGVTNGYIEVAVSNNAVSSTNQFSVLPTVLGFSPSAGSSGSVVTITGTALNAGSPTVTFTGGTSVTPSDKTYYQLLVSAPSTALSGPLKVTTGNGSATTTNNFYMPPSIQGFPPTNKMAWGGTVTITGENFTNASQVLFNGTTATFTVTNNEKIGAVVPFGATTGSVKVTTPGGTATSQLIFQIPPAIASVTPAAALPGASVTLNGIFPDPPTNVTFNGVSATIVSSSTNAIVVTVPTNAATGPIILKSIGGTVTAATTFYVLPLISGFNPASGAAGTTVTISGIFNDHVTNVFFNGATASIVQSSNSFVIALAPPNAGAGPISVSSLGGTTVSSSNFLESPLISSFTPTNGPWATLVTITGLFPDTAPAVAFNGTAATVASWTTSNIVATVPANAATGPISVVASGSTNASATPFTVTYWLSIAASNSIATITWPTNAVGCALQYRTNLDTSPWFSAVAPKISNNMYVSTNKTSSTPRYYRLIK